jgi:hypothetical protein
MKSRRRICALYPTAGICAAAALFNSAETSLRLKMKFGPMSELGQWRRFSDASFTSALTLKADIDFKVGMSQRCQRQTTCRPMYDNQNRFRPVL